jgi:hypothetical protein
MPWFRFLDIPSLLIKSTGTYQGNFSLLRHRKNSNYLPEHAALSRKRFMRLYFSCRSAESYLLHPDVGFVSCERWDSTNPLSLHILFPFRYYHLIYQYYSSTETSWRYQESMIWGKVQFDQYAPRLIWIFYFVTALRGRESSRVMIKFV